MDIFLSIIGIILLLVGVMGCFVPVIPGPPLSYLGVLCMHFTSYVQFSWKQLVFYGIWVILMQIVDFITPMLGTKVSGGSEWGKKGCIIGTLLGAIFFPPWGILFGPFAGAMIGELIGGKSLTTSIKSGTGAFMGFLFSVVLKLTVCVYFLYACIQAWII